VCLAEEAAMAINESEVVSFIKNLRLSELRPLIETLERELGVSAQVAQVAQVAWRTSNPPSPFGNLYDVVLIEPGPRRLEVIRALREALGLDLRSARDLADRPNAVVREQLEVPEASALVARLEAAGARVERRQAG
jgi:large subunit ribosomal protein L7/L12